MFLFLWLLFQNLCFWKQTSEWISCIIAFQMRQLLGTRLKKKTPQYPRCVSVYRIRNEDYFAVGFMIVVQYMHVRSSEWFHTCFWTSVSRISQIISHVEALSRDNLICFWANHKVNDCSLNPKCIFFNKSARFSKKRTRFKTKVLDFVRKCWIFGKTCST